MRISGMRPFMWGPSAEIAAHTLKIQCSQCQALEHPASHPLVSITRMPVSLSMPQGGYQHHQARHALTSSTFQVTVLGSQKSG